MPLTLKQARFVAEYLVDLNATQAAIRCGYSPKTAKQQGSRLLTIADVAAAVAEGQERILKQADITAERTILELGRLAFSDRRGVWVDGKLKPLKDWTTDEAACLEGFEVIVKNAAAGDGHMDLVHKVKLTGKLGALEVLAKHFGLLVNRVDVTGKITLEDLIVASRGE